MPLYLQLFDFRFLVLSFQSLGDLTYWIGMVVWARPTAACWGTPNTPVSLIDCSQHLRHKHKHHHGSLDVRTPIRYQNQKSKKHTGQEWIQAVDQHMGKLEGRRTLQSQGPVRAVNRAETTWKTESTRTEATVYTETKDQASSMMSPWLWRWTEQARVNYMTTSYTYPQWVVTESDCKLFWSQAEDWRSFLFKTQNTHTYCI